MINVVSAYLDRKRDVVVYKTTYDNKITTTNIVRSEAGSDDRQENDKGVAKNEGRRFWTNGSVVRASRECPGPDFVLGRKWKKI